MKNEYKTIYPENNWSDNSYIIVEKPHQGKVKIWTALDDQDLIKKCNAQVESLGEDTSEYDMETVDGCLDWNAHDLSYQTIYKRRDADLLEAVNQEFIYKELVEAAIYLEWVEKDNR